MTATFIEASSPVQIPFEHWPSDPFRPWDDPNEMDSPSWGTATSLPAAEAEPNWPKLPACQVCHSRKVKCDNGRPKCAPCTKSGSKCTIADATGGDPISREYIAELEAKLHRLSTNHQEGPEDTSNGRTPGSDCTVGSLVAPSPHASVRSAETSTTTVQGAGLSFMASLFSDPEWRNNHLTLLNTLAKASRAAETNVEPNALPCEADARFCFDRYLQGSHVQCPFLLTREVQELFDRVFSSGPDPELEHGFRDHDLFRANMILAIGSVIPFRHRTFDHHPFGFYLAAMQHFDPVFLRGDLSSIQNLLLIGRFGIYYHIGTSIWELLRLCMRMCVEQGLHRLKTPGMDLLDDQIRRRVFWTCYVMDRYSSVTLNRPFAITQNDIKIGLPVDADDAEVSALTGSVDSLDSIRVETHIGSKQSPTEMSVFLLCVRLRQISSRVHNEFSRHLAKFHSSREQGDAGVGERSLTATGHIYATMDSIVQELAAWRRSAPFFDSPRSLYERQEWFDLLQTRETFHVVRKAVDLVPKRNGIPSRHIMSQCLRWAIRTIQQYSDLFQQHIVTYTRSYFHMMVTAGLSVLYYASVYVIGCPPDESGGGPANECRDALAQCGDTLAKMATDLPDARHYVALFEALHHHVTNKLQRSLQPQQTEQTIPDKSLQHSAGSNIWQSQHQQYSVPKVSSQALDLPSKDCQEQPNQPQHLGQAYNEGWDGQTNNQYAFNPAFTTASGQDGRNSRTDNQPNFLPWVEQSGLGGSGSIGVLNNGAQAFSPQGALSWGFLNDEFLWNMGNYVYGDMNEAIGIPDYTQFGL